MQRRVEVIRSERSRARASWGEARELGRRLEQAARRLGVFARPVAPVTLKIVDLRQMSQLHLQWMGLPGPTDVLSIPAFDPREDTRGGDIALCWPWIQRQARVGPAQNPLHEATVLAVHGLLHLWGYDHAARFAARDMHRMERRLLRSLGVPDLPRPYPF